MMSVSNVSAGAADSGYYKTEGYYKAGTPEGDAAAQWFGKAAEKLAAEGQSDLSGRVDDDYFARLLNGYAPPTERDADGNWKEGQTLGRYVEGERQHRPGIDLTFSASKSVSIMALVAGDDRIIEAHDRAVKSALAYVENNLVFTRREENGEMVKVQADGMIAAVFRHDSSRALDPQLHSHAVITNMVMSEDGKFRALSNEEIYNGKMVVGEIYRNELARSLQQLGYLVDRSGPHAVPEIASVTDRLNDAFSKRAQQIAEALEKRGLDDSAENRSLAALATRARKNGGIDRSEVREAWAQEAKEAGFGKDQLDRIIAEAEIRRSRTLPGVTRDGPQTQGEHVRLEAREALKFAIAHLSERQSVYGENDLLRVALPRLERGGIEQLGEALKDARQQGPLLPAGKQGQQQLYTDRDTIAVERAILTELRSGLKGGGVVLKTYESRGAPDRSPEKTLEKQLERTSLSPGQRDAVFTALTGNRRFVGVQGYAGTGKTYALETLNRYAEKAGYTVEGLAPSGRAVEALKEAIPSAGTLQGFLTAVRNGGTPRATDKSKAILVVDEASMIGSRDMRDLMQYANKAGYARVVLVGDIKQLDAVDAGQPFAQLQRAGLPTALMADIQRQRTEESREMVLHAIRGEVRAALDKIQTVVQTKPETPLPRTVADRWLGLRLGERDGTGIVVQTNAVRHEINDHIREGLRLEARIGTEDHSQRVLQPQNLTTAEANDARSYSHGDIVIPLKTSRAAGLVKDELYRVVDVIPRTNQITLASETTGEARTLSLKQGSGIGSSLTTFEDSTRDFAVGERVKFAITDKKVGVTNGDRAVIREIGETAIRLQMADGTQTTLPRDSRAVLGMDHAYAATAHDFQGATVHRIIVGMSATERLADQKTFYVDISRARDGVTLVTTDVEKLANRLSDNTGERASALDSWLASKRGDFAQKAAVAAKALDQAAAAITKDQPNPIQTTQEKAKPDALDRDHLDRFGQPLTSDEAVRKYLEDFKQNQKIKEGPIR